jgi:hypothetical protein
MPTFSSILRACKSLVSGRVTSPSMARVFPRVECLECRIAPAITDTWIGGPVNHFWNVGANWSGSDGSHRVPGQDDTVILDGLRGANDLVFPAVGTDPTNLAGSYAIRSLYIKYPYNNTMWLNGTTLVISGTLSDSSLNATIDGRVLALMAGKSVLSIRNNGNVPSRVLLAEADIRDVQFFLGDGVLVQRFLRLRRFRLKANSVGGYTSRGALAKAR